MAKVNDALGDARDRSAYFISVFAFVLPDGTEQIFEGRCNGQMVWPPRGTGGHGYDPIFMADGETRTFGEMTLDEKAKYSHRAKAFQKFIEILK
jgi:XTP/dITP diphosphohydrolase